MARRVEVQLVGDSRSLERAFDRAGDKGKKFDSQMGRSASALKGFAKAGAIGAAVGGAALLTKGLISSVKAAKEAQIAQVQLNQALKVSGVSYKKHGKAIDDAIQKTSKLAAIDDEELSGSFAKLVRTTGSVTKATKGMALAANISRARNVSLEAATKAVEKAYLGSDMALRRLGITVPKYTKAQDALKVEQDAMKESLKNATGEEKLAIETRLKAIDVAIKLAKEQDKQSGALAAIDKAQKKYANSGEAYGKTLAGAQERFQIAVENLQESIGKHLVPALTRLAIKATTFIEWAEKNWPRFAAKVREMWAQVKPVFDAFIAYLDGWIKLVQGIIQGDWLLAWKGLKKVVVTGFELLYAYLKAVPARFFQFGFEMGKKLADGVIAGIGNLVDRITDKIPFVSDESFQKKIDAAKRGRGATPVPATTDPRPQGRAAGGPVGAGRSYIVGERGPEILTMGASGHVTPGGITIGTVHVHGVQNVRGLVGELERVARSTGSQQRGQYGGQALALN